MLAEYVVGGHDVPGASRRRLLLAVVVVTFVLVGVSAWGFERLTTIECADGVECSPVEQKAIAAVLVTLITFMYSFVFALGAVLVAAPSVSSEVESGVLLAMLPRPITRAEVVVGKWLGLSALIVGYAVTTAGAQFAAVAVLVGYTPPHPLVALAFLAWQSVVMLTLGLLLSTRLAPMTGGLIALVLFGLAWIGGIAEGIGGLLGSDSVRNAGLATRYVLPSDGLWRGALFNIQPSFVRTSLSGAQRSDAAENPFFVFEPPTTMFVAWSIIWVLAVLGMAMWSFRRRDL